MPKKLELAQSIQIDKAKCPQCNADLQAEFHFCPNCGQERIKPKETLRDVFTSFLGDYFAYDSKLSLSIKPLLFNPGFLSLQYMKGVRVRYISPLRLYIFISILFFILLNWSGNSPLAGSSADAIMWNDFFHDYLPKIFFFLLPLFAGLLTLMHKKLKLGYVFHLIVSLHFHAFLFFLLSVYLLLSKFIAFIGYSSFNIFILSTFIGWILLYLLFGLKRIYRLSWKASIMRFILLLVVYGVILFLVMITILGYITLKP